ncbi:MFS transporter [Bifidobacterium aemilianum]|uniref:MFS transporter n=2 Tax=Bifidobacterium aemilianum TaxID=2493120 RepID=A0A366K9N0_9BIFI|nr:MFS transporter [Bifidobacterium aemilianum]
MTAVEGTIVSTAMPTIVSDLKGLSLMNWVFSIYMLMCAVATPVYGKLSDRYGRKRLMNIGLLVFVVGSLLCGISQSMIQLILSRVVQGLGAGAIQPLTFSILADIYPVEKRAQMIGLNGSSWGIASVIAPLLGGFIVEQLSWHWVFAINIPIGLLVVIVIQCCLQEQTHPRKTPIDYRGIVLLVLALVTLMLGLQNLNSPHWVPWGLMPLLASLALIVALVIVERQEVDPILPLKLFTNRTFIVENTVILLVSGFLMGFETYLPIWMQSVLGLKPSMGGFALTPSSLVWLLGAYLAGRFLITNPPHRIMALALVFLIGACGSYVLLPITTPFWAFLIISCFYGFGFGLAITIGTVTSQSVVSAENVGTATSFNTLARSLGQTMMISVFGIVMNLVTARQIGSHPGLTMDMMNKMVNPDTAGSLPERFLEPARGIVYDGLHWIFVLGLVLLIAAFLINLLDFKSKHLLADSTAVQSERASQQSAQAKA